MLAKWSNTQSDDSNSEYVCFNHAIGPARLSIDLPTIDPEVEGQLWNDSNTLKISSGGSA